MESEKRVPADKDSPAKSLITALHLKYVEKPWSETINLVCRCMEKRKKDSNVPSKQLLDCLERLHKALNATSFTDMVTRLEIIAKHKGLGSHLSPSEDVCYITSDIFYLEVLFQPAGEVADVKVAHHGEAPVSSEMLCNLLRLKNFEEFGKELEGLSSLFNTSGDSETNMKMFSALQFVEKDLLKMFQIPRPVSSGDPWLDNVLHGRIGNVTPRNNGIRYPMSIEYYISPYDLLEEKMKPESRSCGNKVFVTAEVTNTIQRLPSASVIADSPQMTNEGFPVHATLDDLVSMELSACLFLKFPRPVPILSCFIEEFHRLTAGISVSEDLKQVPFYELLMKTKMNVTTWGSDSCCFLVTLPGHHRQGYVISQQWWLKPWEGALVHKIPFTHPGHVPSLLSLLRHQTAFSTLIASCVTGNEQALHLSMLNELDFHFEILPYTGTSFSLSFQHPVTGSMASLFVNVVDSNHISCKLFPPEVPDPSIDDWISKVMKRCMSIPVTMRAIFRKIASRETPTASETGAAPENTSEITATTSSSLPIAQENTQSANHCPGALVMFFLQNL
uniref:Mediator of RNA polymerase II transcription subunit 1 n=1 Tax=Lepisosteus oculatus TaxID=7918 RepID=W5N203_LEPOC